MRATLYPPYIIERSSRGERTYDIFSRLLMDRIVFLGAPINDDVANIIIAQLLFLEADNPEKDIYLYINSPGGVVSAGMAIYDTMQHLMNTLYAKHTGQPIETIERDMDRDRFMSAEEAKAYGLIDTVFSARKDLVVPSKNGAKETLTPS